ncbi:MAG: tRNA (adenosine(37)-N6)-dimethylallyltransferase MiaA [Patescibacteria group bacterium]
MQRIIVIVGPTASGKSDLAVALANRFDGEVISADSRQVYRGLDIGTGKITQSEMRGIPHHLLDVASPSRVFTAHDFAKHARRAITEIAARGHTPIIAGGTGFYIDALVGRIALAPVKIDKALRKKLDGKTTKQLLALLRRRDKVRAEAVVAKNEMNNRHRLIRAIEISYTKKMSAHAHPTPAYDILWIGIKPNPQILKERIRLRLTQRLDAGMTTEGEHLHASGLSYKRMEALGLEYRYLALFLQKKITRGELVEQLSAKIWQYARRQTTYWKRNTAIHWLPLQKTADMVAQAQKVLSELW